MPAPLLDHPLSSLEKNFARKMRASSSFFSDSAAVDVDVEPGSLLGEANAFGVDDDVVGRIGLFVGELEPSHVFFLAGGDPKDDLFAFTIFRCRSISEPARAISFCGRGALSIVLCFKISSLARLIFCYCRRMRQQDLRFKRQGRIV